MAAIVALSRGRLVPLPDSDFNHVVLAEKTNDDIMWQVIDAIITMGKRTRLSDAILATTSIESKERMAAACHQIGVDCESVEMQGNLVLDMNSLSPQEIWNSVFNSRDSQRKYIRRFEKTGFRLRECSSPVDIEIFHKYYSANLKIIGGHPLNLNQFKKIFNICTSDELRMTLLEKDGLIAGGLITLFSRHFKTAFFRYLALNRDLPGSFHSPYPLFWDGINDAYDKGYRKISFGPGPNDKEIRSVQIKKAFGAHYKEVHAIRIFINPALKSIRRVYQSLTHGQSDLRVDTK